jgi:RES domain-containing protein
MALLVENPSGPSTITVYRIQKLSREADLLTGVGASLTGGRWNPKGVPIVYCASNPELALLEVLVHLDQSQRVNHQPLSVFGIQIPDHLLFECPIETLPEGWNAHPRTAVSESFLASLHAHGRKHLAYRVPSTILPLSPSRNILIDPTHPSIREVTYQSHFPIQLDSRL